MSSHIEKQPGSPWIYAALAIFTVIIALLLGQWATFPNLAGWYAHLVKPGFNPPNWIFGPMWTLLYALMAYSSWRIWRLSSDVPGRSTALLLFYAQLSLNALWSWMFFGLNNPMAGLIDIVPQWLLILATIHAFRKLDAQAAYCLVPLAAWVAFAMLLNFEIWRLNG
ncbi:tryptophan-rich sensory protein [Rhizobium sp. P38BS-XIX]|uniref:TspO/MBR family protein n=1 Tax=Rhizobium sp. P38BS-XIX TaxID=2726740 RepID=UPI001456FFD5|nr:TspO/MBR family protein [Rhizobium sp. P38BS-XIX]NLS01317.1 tryptophan-rich sensory protein [Rhizobium sp. P38BS-XIX]